MKLYFKEGLVEHVYDIINIVIHNAMAAKDGDLVKDLNKLRSKLEGTRDYYNFKQSEIIVLLEFSKAMRASFTALLSDLEAKEMQEDEKKETREKAEFYLQKTKDIIEYLEEKMPKKETSETVELQKD